MHILAAAVVALFAAAPAPRTQRVAMVDDVCSVTGSRPASGGKGAVTSKGNPSVHACDRTGGEITCVAHVRAPKTKFLGSGGKQVEINLSVALDSSSALVLVSNDGTHVLVDAESRRYAYAHTFVDVANGVIMHKHCTGTYLVDDEVKGLWDEVARLQAAQK